VWKSENIVVGIVATLAVAAFAYSTFWPKHPRSAATPWQPSRLGALPVGPLAEVYGVERQSPSGRGSADLDLGGRLPREGQIIPGRTVVQGSLSKDVISKIIRQHQNEVKYCYEQELRKNPNLYGKIAVSFTVEGTGDVSEATVNETTMNNSNVETCLTVHIQRWKFPEPRGGAQVFVTYPWVFKASATE